MTKSRLVDERGETLIVRNVQGVRALTDATDPLTVVHVSSGRRARLVSFDFCGLTRLSGRDALTEVFSSDAGLGFAGQERPRFSVLLRELSVGQRVDILPASNAAPARAAYLPPMPVPEEVTAAKTVYAVAA